MRSPYRALWFRVLGPRFSFGLFGIGLLLTTAGCTSTEVGAQCPVPAGATPEQQQAALCACQHGVFEQISDTYRWKKLDFLFVVGNTPSMVKKQQALAAVLPELLAALDEKNADYHIGVVSTDIGSWTASDTPWAGPAGSCDSFSGDDGRLQAVSCLERSKNSAAAASACAAVCPDRKFVPTDGAPFVSGRWGKVNVPESLQTDARTGRVVDYGPVYALQCMIMLGDGGCEVSAPLESARRALNDHLLANSGFRRPGATLYIAFLTDADDCSVQPARRRDNAPQTQNCAAPEANAAASCYSRGAYRCLARDVTCDQPLNVAGKKTGCRGREDSYLEPVDSYIRFFTSLAPPARLATAGIWTAAPLTAAGELQVAQDPNIPGSAGLGFSADDPAGCVAAGDPTLRGQPQHRLGELFTALNRSHSGRLTHPASVCDSADYLSAFDLITERVISDYAPECLLDVPARLPDGSPACLVEDVPLDPRGAPARLLPVCSAGCCAAFGDRYLPAALDPKIRKSCAAEPADCYCITPSDQGRCRDSKLAFGAWRKDNADPPDTFINVRCALSCPSAASADRRP